MEINSLINWLKENKNSAKRDTSHFKIHLLSEISLNMEINVLKFITTSLKVFGSAIIKFDVWISAIPQSSYQQNLSSALQSRT